MGDVDLILKAKNLRYEFFSNFQQDQSKCDNPDLLTTDTDESEDFDDQVPVKKSAPFAVS